MSIEEELKEIKFRMGLLRDGTELSMFIYDCNVKEDNWKSIREYFRELDDRVYNGEKINSSSYEAEILSLVNNKGLDYHFAEGVAKLQWEDGRYKEVFEELYKDSAKFKGLFK